MTKKDGFIKYLQSIGKSDDIIKRHLYRLSHLQYLSDFDEKTIVNYIEKKKKEGARHSSLNKLIQTFIIYSKFLGKEIKIKSLPPEHIQRKTLTNDQIHKIIAVNPPPDMRGVFFAICAYTGMRPCEVASLQASDFDLVAGTIEISLNDTQTKRHRRSLPIMPILLPIIVEYLDLIDSDALFPSYNIGYWGKAWRKQCGQVNINAPLYSLRRSFVTQGAADGIKLEEMQALMGHSNINTTVIYYQQNMSVLKKAISKHSLNFEAMTAEEAIQAVNSEIAEIYAKLVKNKDVMVSQHATEDSVFFEVRKRKN